MTRPPPLTDALLYPVTTGLALLAIFVSGAWWTGHPVNQLFMDAAMLDGEIWRLVTSILPHVNFLHLFFNLSWVWYFGTLLERTYGGLATLVLVFVLAATSMGSEYAVMHGGVGLSGVGYGYWALFAVLAKYDRRFADVVDKRTNMTFAFWFGLCIVATYFDVMRVANLAHGVGAAVGWLIGSVLVKRPMRWLYAAGVVALVVFAIAGATYARPYTTLVHDSYSESNACVNALEAEAWERAQRLCTMALRVDPNDEISYWNLGIADLRSGRDTSASRHIMSGAAPPK